MGQHNNINPIEDVIHVKGNILTVKVGEYLLTLKIEGRKAKPRRRIQLKSGQTLFDLLLEAANTFVKDTGENEFTAAVLYQVVREKHPELDIRRNSWNAYVIRSTPNHPSYRYHTSHRSFFRYLGRGKYSLETSLAS